MNDYMAQVWPLPDQQADPAPLTGTPPVMLEPEPSPAGISWRKLFAVAWCIGFVALHLAAILLLISDDPMLQLQCTSPLEPIAAVIAPFVLWPITLIAAGELTT